MTKITSGNYLRVRGEYPRKTIVHTDVSELPPRARRIPVGVVAVCSTPGTTSACAENTVETNIFVCSAWNYLRVRGEYFTRIS